MRLIDADVLYIPPEEMNAKMAVAYAPTIDAVPVKHGKWEVKGQDVYCSVCGKESAYTWHGSSKFSSYCPNCGAKMDGERKDNEVNEAN